MSIDWLFIVGLKNRPLSPTLVAAADLGRGLAVAPLPSSPFPSSSPSTMLAVYSVAGFLALLFFLQMQQLVMAVCPLDLSGSNFTLAASACSNQVDRGKCCPSINAFVAISVSRYANATEMLQSPNFEDVVQNCEVPLSPESRCRRCLNAGILFLHRLIGAEGNMTLSTCRDASFVTLASRGDNVLATNLASCFLGVQELSSIPANTSEPSAPSDAPEASPSPISAATPIKNSTGMPLKEHHPYHLTLIPGIGIAVTGTAVLLLVILVLLSRRKSRELKGSEDQNGTAWKGFPQPIQKCLKGPSSVFRRFNYKETKKATDNFSTVIGRGGFRTVYKAEFSNGIVVAVKRMNKASVQLEDEFCREMELLGRLHHRHLVALKGFCMEKNERFLMYEYMENGSLKDHLHTPGKTPLSWQMRIQNAIDVANALEYLHFYCDPPLCHRDIKSSNILLDENFVAKELTEKSDVYSYGVLLLELVTARRAIQESRNLVEWSQKFMVTDSRLPELVDPAIAGSFDLEQLQTVKMKMKQSEVGEGLAGESFTIVRSSFMVVTQGVFNPPQAHLDPIAARASCLRQTSITSTSEASISMAFGGAFTLIGISLFDFLNENVARDDVIEVTDMSGVQSSSPQLVVKRKDIQDLGDGGWLQRPEGLMEWGRPNGHMEGHPCLMGLYGQVAKGATNDKIIEGTTDEIVASGATGAAGTKADSCWACAS
ncbi:hypothetical protein ACLOJK_039427 [Asimina triloba]